MCCSSGCSKCCVDISKFFLFIVNFLAWAASLAVVGGCVYLLLQSKEILDFEIVPDFNGGNSTAVHFTLILIVITVFGFLFIFTFLGCCGAACTNRCMLGSYIIILFVFLGAAAGGILVMFLNFGDELEMAKSELKKTIPYYKVDQRHSVATLFWDHVQPGLGCCGAEKWEDWKEARPAVLKPGMKVIDKCCKPGNDDCTFNEPTDESIYIQGCVDRVGLEFRLVFWAIPAIMSVMLILAICVCSRASQRKERNAYEQRDRRGGGGRGRKRSGESQYSEETGYVYRPTPPTPQYPTAPPYNPQYNEMAEYNQPLMSRPPPYHDVTRR